MPYDSDSMQVGIVALDGLEARQILLRLRATFDEHDYMHRPVCFKKGKESVNLAKLYGGYFDEVLSQISEDVIATKPKVYSYHDVTAALDSRSNNTPSVIRVVSLCKVSLCR
eukprot:scaffold15736_cov75-Skeletonema_marinoi.AAC.4